MATATLQDASLPDFEVFSVSPLALVWGETGDLDKLIFTKGGKTTDPAVLNLTVLPRNLTLHGLGDLDNDSSNGYQLQGTASALASSFASASATAPNSGAIGLTLTLTDAAGHSSSYQYPISIYAPPVPVFRFGNGVGNGATAAEATDSSGVLLVTAKSGSALAVTFTDSSGNSLNQNLVGTGTAQALTLGHADLGSAGAHSLRDGLISVTVVASEALADSSTGSISFVLDTVAPQLTGNYVWGNQLTLHYSEAMGSDALASAAEFTLSDGTAVTAVSTKGSDVVLTLAHSYATTDTLPTLGYTPGNGHTLHDVAGNTASGLVSQALIQPTRVTLTSALNDPANAGKALDVTSDLVFGVGASFATGTLVAGSGSITIHSNSDLTIPVLVNGGLNPLIHIGGSGANTTINISPNANFDFELATSYSVSIPAGAFLVAGTDGRTAAISASFTTVAPAEVTVTAENNKQLWTPFSTATGTFDGNQSYRMNSSTGALDASNKWVSVNGLGSGYGAAQVALDLANGDYTLAVTDQSPEAPYGWPGTENYISGVMPQSDIAVLLKNFGKNDRIYVNEPFSSQSLPNALGLLGTSGLGTDAWSYHIALDRLNARSYPYIEVVFADGVVSGTAANTTVTAWNAVVFGAAVNNPYNSIVIGG